jgi:hypothetical protein
VGDKQPSPPELAVFNRNRSGLGINYFSKGATKSLRFCGFTATS